jgi:hypothetical protein
MAPSSQELEPPQKPGRFMDAVNQKFNDFYEKRELNSDSEESSLKAAYTM